MWLWRHCCNAPVFRRTTLRSGTSASQLHLRASFLSMQRKRWMTAHSACTWRKKQIRARRGLLFYVTSAATNIEEALALFARYSRIVNEAVRIKRASAREGLIAEISFIGLSGHAAKQVTEFGVGVTIKALREIAGRKIRPTHLSFLHARSS